MFLQLYIYISVSISIYIFILVLTRRTRVVFPCSLRHYDDTCLRIEEQIRSVNAGEFLGASAAPPSLSRCAPLSSLDDEAPPLLTSLFLHTGRLGPRLQKESAGGGQKVQVDVSVARGPEEDGAQDLRGPVRRRHVPQLRHRFQPFLANTCSCSSQRHATPHTPYGALLSGILIGCRSVLAI